MKKQILLFLFACSLFGFHYVDAQNSGNILIADHDITDATIKAQLDTISKAALILESSTRGLLLPRMTYENMGEIRDPKDGLILYVTYVNTDGDNDKREEGLWFFDGELDVWRRLKEMNDPKSVSEPIGTIVAYVGNTSNFENGLGKLGTEVQGWAICDNQNSNISFLPDLTDKFVAGSIYEDFDRYNEDFGNYDEGLNTDAGEVDAPLQTDCNEIGDEGGVNFTHISYNQIPTHRHNAKDLPIMDIGHTHQIDDFLHDHTIRAVYGSCGEEKDARATSGNLARTFDTEMEGTEEIIIKASSFSLSVGIPAEAVQPFGKSQADVENYDNRPPFYTVIFIMKVGFSYYNEVSGFPQVEIYLED